jgi:hypothetical protein
MLLDYIGLGWCYRDEGEVKVVGLPLIEAGRTVQVIDTVFKDEATGADIQQAFEYFGHAAWDEQKVSRRRRRRLRLLLLLLLLLPLLGTCPTTARMCPPLRPNHSPRPAPNQHAAPVRVLTLIPNP